MSNRACLTQRWRSFLGLGIAGGMVLWTRFLGPSSVDWLSGVYTTYWGLCVIASLASITLALREMTARGPQPR
jgi:hypothetical protein